MNISRRHFIKEATLATTLIISGAAFVKYRPRETTIPSAFVAEELKALDTLSELVAENAKEAVHVFRVHNQVVYCTPEVAKITQLEGVKIPEDMNDIASFKPNIRLPSKVNHLEDKLEGKRGFYVELGPIIEEGVTSEDFFAQFGYCESHNPNLLERSKHTAIRYSIINYPTQRRVMVFKYRPTLFGAIANLKTADGVELSYQLGLINTIRRVSAQNLGNTVDYVDPGSFDKIDSIGIQIRKQHLPIFPLPYNDSICVESRL